MIIDIELFYKLERQLGSGGFGTVYLGENIQHKYKAALKSKTKTHKKNK